MNLIFNYKKSMLDGKKVNLLEEIFLKSTLTISKHNYSLHTRDCLEIKTIVMYLPILN